MHVTTAHDSVIPSVDCSKELQEADRLLDEITFGTRWQRFFAWLKELWS